MLLIVQTSKQIEIFYDAFYRMFQKLLHVTSFFVFFFAVLKCQIHFMISQYTSHNLGPQVGKLQPAFKRFPDFCLADEATETERSPR